ncbi:MAG: response regulator transcription factor [Clostridiaceae bacterium]|nr:response regulator transcription factor [Clostridiaceae bacterium]
MPIIKVFIADDAPEIRSYFQMIMKNEPDMEVVGTASSGKEAVEKVMKLCPDIVLMDIQMENRMAGIEAIEQIREINPNIKSIVLTIHEKDDFLFKAYAAGAADYIIKTRSVVDIINSIRNVMANRLMLRPEVANKLMGEYRRIKEEQGKMKGTLKVMTKLTNTEFEILKLVFNGYSYKTIAQQRFVEETTIRSQVYWILKKFGMQKMKDVIHLLIELNIFDIYDL